MEFRLLALLPPGGVERKISELRESLTSIGGLAAAASLPPLVPLLFLPAQLPLPVGMSRPEGLGPPFSLDTAGYLREGGFLFLEARSGGCYDRLRESLERRCPCPEGTSACRTASRAPELYGTSCPQPFPLLEGFLLARMEGPVLQGNPDEPQLPPPPPACSFPAKRLWLVEADTLDPAAPWWEALEWEARPLLRLKRA